METQRIEHEVRPELRQGYLIPFSQPGGASIPLPEFLTIGRETFCQLVLKDAFVSGRHARIERRTDGYVLRDLQSRNGTHLNGSRVTEVSLSTNDRIRFGETTFIFSEVPAGEAPLRSKNPEWNEQLSRLPAFAATDFPVLITGPSGSGKEILARAVHLNSARAAGPYISINCSALSESLIESELFGHVRGSFTGAMQDRKGAFESARGGTLFLDEIGDLPLTLQPKLLRALENNEIRPVGSDRAVETDVRIIAATHKNLTHQALLGRFREDLFYRLNVCQLRPPGLKDRMEDFEDLAYHFAKLYRVRFSFQAMEALKIHDWPGNVRELKNLVARASAYFPGKHLQPGDLPSLLEVIPPSVPEADALPAAPRAAPGVESPLGGLTNLNGTNGSVIKELEREIIVRRLIANNGNQKKTAKDLGMPKSTLHDRIRSYSIDLEVIGAKSAFKA